MKNILPIIIVILLSFCAKSQDTLILKDGKTIPCLISEIDSSDVYFEMKTGTKVMKTYLSRELINQIKRTAPSQIVRKKNIPAHVNSLAFYLGLSLATKDFGNNDIYDSLAGLAKNGLSINAVFSHQMDNNFSFEVKGLINKNEFLVESIANALRKDTLSVSVASVNYTTAALMGGIALNLPVNKMALFGHAFVGIASLTQPKATFNITTPSNYMWVRYEKVSTSSLIFDIGAGLRYTLDDRWEIQACTDWMFAKFNFGDMTLTASNGQSATSRRGVQNYSSVNFTLGLILKLL